MLCTQERDILFLMDWKRVFLSLNCVSLKQKSCANYVLQISI